jgi:molybdenum storage protein
MKESLLRLSTKLRSEAKVFPLMPDVSAVQIGGKLIDGGKESLLPILDELRANQLRHKVILAVGSGKRARHVMAVAQDLGLPIGLVAELRRLDTELNSHIVGALLSPYGIPELTHGEMVHMLPAMLAISRVVVFNGVPPYDIWEHLPPGGEGPPTGSDAGLLLFAETCGMKQVVYLRDVNGIYTSDPNEDRGAKMLEVVRASSLLRNPLGSLPVDLEAVKLIPKARRPVRVSVVSGQVRGALTKALERRRVGSRVLA